MFAPLRRRERGLISIERSIFRDGPNPGLERTESQLHHGLSLERDSRGMVFTNSLQGWRDPRRPKHRCASDSSKKKMGVGGRNLEPNTPTLPWLVFVSLTLGICYNLWLVPFSIRYSFHFAFSSAHQEELAAGSRQFLASHLLSLPRATQPPRFHCRWGFQETEDGDCGKRTTSFPLTGGKEHAGVVRVLVLFVSLPICHLPIWYQPSETDTNSNQG